jgi:hypothetical protein
MRKPTKKSWGIDLRIRICTKISWIRNNGSFNNSVTCSKKQSPRHFQNQYFLNCQSFLIKLWKLFSRVEYRINYILVTCIAGHRHQDRYRRHPHSGILYFNPIPEHYRHFCSLRYWTDWMPDSSTFRHLKIVIIIIIIRIQKLHI